MRSILTVAAATASALLAGCGAAPSVPSPAAASPAAAVAVPLAPLLVTQVPTGFVQQADSVGDTGPSNLAKAARDDGQPSAAAVLTADGFLAGYQRFWARPDGTYLVVYLYQFSAPAGANAYEQRGIAILRRGSSTGTLNPVAITAFDGATGFTGSVQGRAADDVVFTRGSFLVQVAAEGGGATQAMVVAVAGAQRSRLP